MSASLVGSEMCIRDSMNTPSNFVSESNHALRAWATPQCETTQVTKRTKLHGRRERVHTLQSVTLASTERPD
eukprot:3126622-Alexandrium_andersonii.AAC.1